MMKSPFVPVKKDENKKSKNDTEVISDEYLLAAKNMALKEGFGSPQNLLKFKVSDAPGQVQGHEWTGKGDLDGLPDGTYKIYKYKITDYQFAGNTLVVGVRKDEATGKMTGFTQVVDKDNKNVGATKPVLITLDSNPQPVGKVELSYNVAQAKKNLDAITTDTRFGNGYFGGFMGLGYEEHTVKVGATEYSVQRVNMDRLLISVGDEQFSYAISTGSVYSNKWGTAFGYNKFTAEQRAQAQKAIADVASVVSNKEW